MQNNFGLEDMLFEVQTVMSNIEEEEPSPFLELTPLEGDMVGTRVLIGEFRMLDVEYENGDGQLQFSATFPDNTKEENDILLEKHQETLNKIVLKMVSEAVSSAYSENENT